MHAFKYLYTNRYYWRILTDVNVGQDSKVMHKLKHTKI